MAAWPLPQTRAQVRVATSELRGQVSVPAAARPPVQGKGSRRFFSAAGRSFKLRDLNDASRDPANGKG